jgi:hypothetical protein
MNKDPYEIAIDQILTGADGDVRLALRTVLIQNPELEARLQVLAARIGEDIKPVQAGNSTVNYYRVPSRRVSLSDFLFNSANGGPPGCVAFG